MSVVAIHDSAGNIASIVTSSGDGPHPVLELPPGLSMTEIELPEGLAEEDLKTRDGVARLSEGYRVELGGEKASLSPR